MNKAIVQLQFALEVEDDWPPVGSESVCCELVGTSYRLKNAPFFIKGLAVNDVFHAEPDVVNGHIFEFRVVEASEHSLVWILNTTGADIEPVLARLRGFGCAIERLDRFSLHAVDVPPDVQGTDLDAVLDSAEEAGLDLGFPVWRRD